MDELIIRAIEGRATEDELASLRKWRASSDENELRWTEVQALWALAGDRTEITPRSRIPSAKEILASENFDSGSVNPSAGSSTPILEPVASRTPAASPAPAGPAPSRARAMLRIAALLLVALGMGYFLLQDPGGHTEVSDRFETAPSELATVTLEDGTVARMGPGTTLEVIIDAGRREVRLDGRAFFAVQPESDRPFIVRAEGGTARVLGTRFEVNSEAERLRVMVLDGRVAMSAGGAESELHSGDIGESTDGSSAPRVHQTQDPERLLDWMGAWVGFTSTPLARVARELDQRFGILLYFADPDIEERTITGWFDDDDLDHMVEMICRAAAVACLVEADTIRVEDLP